MVWPHHKITWSNFKILMPKNFYKKKDNRLIFNWIFTLQHVLILSPSAIICLHPRICTTNIIWHWGDWQKTGSELHDSGRAATSKDKGSKTWNVKMIRWDKLCICYYAPTSRHLVSSLYCTLISSYIQCIL